MSNKFTGITSAGSAIPVYDKDAHSALEQKLDTSAFSSVSGSFLTEVPESAVSGFATHEEVESATSGKANTSRVLDYFDKPSANAVYAAYNTLSNVEEIYGKADSNFYIVPSSILQVPEIITATTGRLSAGNLTADEYGIRGGRTRTSYSGSADGAFRIYASQYGVTVPFIQLIGAETAEGNGVYIDVYGASGVDAYGRKRWNIKNGAYDTNPSFSMEGAAAVNGNGVYIDVNGASGVDSYGNVKWQVGGPASQLFNGAQDKKPAILLVSPPTSDQYSAQWSAGPYISAGDPSQGITLSYGPTANTPYVRVMPDRINSDYTSSHASFAYFDVTVSRYSAWNDPDKKEWSLTGSVQKREIECDSATSAITAIAGSAIGGFIPSGAEIVNHDNTLSGNGTVDSPLGVVRGYNETVLWEGDAGSSDFPITLSEAATNFERIRIVWKWNGSVAQCAIVSEHAPTDADFCLHNAADLANNQYFTNGRFTYTTNYTKIEYSWGIQAHGSWNTPASEEKQIHFYKVIGINRKAQ